MVLSTLTPCPRELADEHLGPVRVDGPSTRDVGEEVKILVAIANYGTANQEYLAQLIETYRKMTFDVDIVVLSNIPKDFAPPTEVVVGLPARNPWSLPFAHREIFQQRVNDYDLFIYSEDDTLVTQRNVEAFLEASELLEPSEIAGFLRKEQDPEGRTHYSTIHSLFRWDVSSVRKRGGDVFARFSNDHAACYILTRDQLQRCIASGGFLVAPYVGRYDMLVSAATDPYTRCGFVKLVCVSRLDEFVLHHLPNKYLGQMGLSRDELLIQVNALRKVADGILPATPLLEVETKLPELLWSRSCYQYQDETLLEHVPSDAREILVYGCGSGVSEAKLLTPGRRVVGVPIDAVLGECASFRGVEVVHGDHATAMARLQGEKFDCVLLPDVLHLVAEPDMLLASVSELLKPGGVLAGSLPDMGTRLSRNFRWKRMAVTCNRHSAEQTGVHVIGARRLRQLLRRQGFQSLETTSYAIRRQRPRKGWRRVAPTLADRVLFRAAKRSLMASDGRQNQPDSIAKRGYHGSGFHSTGRHRR